MSIYIYGASGFTGTLIAQTLCERGLRPLLGGRDRARLAPLAAQLDGLPIRVAHVSDEASLANAMEGVTVVINCAGPFIKLGEPVLRAAIGAGAHYLDTTGEQAFMRDMFERYESLARRGGSVVASGMAFEIAIGDWAAIVAATELGVGDPVAVDLRDKKIAAASPLDELTVAYCIDGIHATRGTRLSAVESLGANSCEWRNGRWDPVAVASESRRIPFPSGTRLATSFPSGEVITVPRTVAVDRVQTFISFSENELVMRATSLLAPLFGPLLRTPLAAIARARASDGPESPTDDQRRSGRFEICAEAKHGARWRRVCVGGVDVYGLTARITADAAMRLDQPAPSEGAQSAVAPGFRTPSELTPAAAALDALQDAGLIELISTGSEDSTPND